MNKHMNIIKSNTIPTPPKNTWVAIDSEWFGMNIKQMHRPTSGRFACMTVAIGEDVYYLDHDYAVEQALDALNDCVWVFHKSDFDIVQLRRLSYIPPRRKLWDTLYIERIMYNGYYDTFALDDVVRRYLDVELDKHLQKAFENATEMTDEMIEYACKDSYYTLKVAQKQHEIIDKDSFKIWKDIDCPALWAIQDFCGFAIDVDKWLALAEKNKQTQEFIDGLLPFNPRSHVQVKKWFSEQGMKLESSDEEHLQEIIRKTKTEKIIEVAQAVLDSRMYGKRASTYGKSWIENYVEYEDSVSVVYAGYNVTGAETGRMAASDPAIQTIPVRDTPEFRECFIARPDHSLIIADYSAQEPRITAYITQDISMIEIFNSGKDIYIEMAKEIFHENITKDDPRRMQMKSLILGMNYGLSEFGLSKRENISVDEAKNLLSQVFRMFPQAASWMEQQRKRKRFVTTIAGRKCHLNPYSDQCERNALNSPLQGTAADMMKKAIGRIHQEWDYHEFGCGFSIAGVIHDELVLDVPTPVAEVVSKFVQQMMVQVAEEMCVGVPFKVDISIGQKWSEK
jgi:DNA polymerase-1